MKRNKKIILGLFVIVAIAQLAAPISMIIKKESVASGGKVYKFKTRPIDPYDPFRGKYIRLNFEQTTTQLENPKEWHGVEMGYFPIEKDEEGYAIVKPPKLTPPDDKDYLAMRIENYPSDHDSIARFLLPFDKFFMNEDEALNAEIEYRSANRNAKKKNAYAKVKLFKGEYVLEDVIIGGVSAKDLK